MRVLVLGGTNFIGAHAVRHLVELGHEVTVFHRGRRRSDVVPVAVRAIHGDRNELDQHAAALCAVEADVLLDMMAITERGTQLALDVLGEAVPRAVMISSMDVYLAYGRLQGTELGEPVPVPFDEDGPLRQVWYPYRGAATGEHDFRHQYDKIPCERLYLAHPTLGATVLRLPMVYGPDDFQHRLFTYLRRMDDRRPAIVLPETYARWRGTRGYVDDVGLAIATAVNDERAAGRVYNVADADTPTEAEWVALIGQAAGWDGEVVAVPDDRLPEDQQPGAGLRQDLWVDASRIRDELGFTPRVDRLEALRRTIAWERAHPPAQVETVDYDADDRLLAELRGA